MILISGISKLNNLVGKTRIRLSNRETGTIVSETYSRSDGKYSFQCIEKDVEYDLRAMDDNRQYRDVTLDAVIGKELS